MSFTPRQYKFERKMRICFPPYIWYSCLAGIGSHVLLRAGSS